MIKEKLKKVKESYKEDDLKEFNRIFKSTEMYLSKNIVEIIIKILVSDMDDYINGYSLVNKKIWQIKKERRELEDDFDNRNQESCSLETTKKQLEMKIKELTLQISIVKSEISTQSACISSIISKLEPKDQPFSEYLLCKPSI